MCDYRLCVCASAPAWMHICVCVCASAPACMHICVCMRLCVFRSASALWLLDHLLSFHSFHFTLTRAFVQKCGETTQVYVIMVNRTRLCWANGSQEGESGWAVFDVYRATQTRWISQGLEGKGGFLSDNIIAPSLRQSHAFPFQPRVRADDVRAPQTDTVILTCHSGNPTKNSH